MNSPVSWPEAAQMPAWPGAAQAAHDLVQYWMKACDAFLKWERENFIEREPSPEELSDHSTALKLMLRLTLLLHAQVADPDFPAPEFLPEISGRLKQLEDSR